MFSFYSVILDLIKARTHKYVRRIPVGITKTGATKYRYFYQGQEGHGKGIAHESELEIGASFAFGEGENRYHAHITKVDGNKITVKHDDGAKKGMEYVYTKEQFQKMVHQEHIYGVEQAKQKANKKLEKIQQKKDRGGKIKQETLDKLIALIEKLTLLDEVPQPQEQEEQDAPTQETSEKVEEHLDTLKEVASIYDTPATVDAPWMTEKEKRVFEGQNRLFKMLENKELTLALLQDYTHHTILLDMVTNVVSAIFKYKDLSRIPKRDLQSIIIATRMIAKPTAPEQIWQQILVVSDLWKKIPFAQETKNTKVGRIDVIQADLTGSDREQKNKNEQNIEAIKKAQEEMINLEPDLSKLVYGNIVYTQLSSALNIKVQGFFAHGTPLEKRQHVTTKLETVSHAADVIYMNSDDEFDMDARMKKHIPKEALRMFQINRKKGTAIHELAHRFSDALLEQNNTDFSNDLNTFFSKFGRKKRNSSTLLNKPIKEYTIAKNRDYVLLSYMLQMPQVNLGTNQISGEIISKDSKQASNTISSVPFDSIDFKNFGNTYIAPTGKGTVNINIQLNNGDILRVPTEKTPESFHALFNPKNTNLPTGYAQQNVKEMFSEMMASVCDPAYKDEPMRTEFVALLKKHKGSFGI